MDLTALTLEQLEAHLIEVRNEIERHHRLAQTPAQITAMAERYIEDGGNVATLAAALPS